MSDFLAGLLFGWIVLGIPTGLVLAFVVFPAVAHAIVARSRRLARGGRNRGGT